MQATFEKIVTPGQSFALRKRDGKEFDFAWHFHPECELTYIVQSHGRRFVGDSIEAYTSGEVILLGANLPHTWSSEPLDGNARHVSFFAQFLPEFLGADLLRAPEFKRVAQLLERAKYGLRIEGAAREHVAREFPKLMEVEGAPRALGFLEILAVLAEAREVQVLCSEGYAPAFKRGDQTRIDAVCQYLNEHYAQPIREVDAAKRAHLSVSAFSRFFKRRMGRSFNAYVNELRIGQACRLLIESEKGVAEIAYESGFTNLSNFNRRFLAVKSMSPRTFRKTFARG